MTFTSIALGLAITSNASVASSVETPSRLYVTQLGGSEWIWHSAGIPAGYCNEQLSERIRSEDYGI
jgi:hypothetical protein